MFFFGIRKLSIKEINQAIEANNRQLLEFQLSLCSIQNDINKKQEQIATLKQWRDEMIEQEFQNTQKDKEEIVTLQPNGLSPLFSAYEFEGRN